MTPIPTERRYLLATENGGHNWLLFDRKNALAQGSYDDVAKARDALERAHRG